MTNKLEQTIISDIVDLMYPWYRDNNDGVIGQGAVPTIKEALYIKKENYSILSYVHGSTADAEKLECLESLDDTELDALLKDAQEKFETAIGEL